MERWYAAKVNCAPRAAIELVNQGFGTWAPMVCHERVVRGRLVKTQHPLFGPYVLVAFDAERDRWQSINSTRGVDHLLPVKSCYPVPLPTGYIEELRQRETDGEFMPSAAVQVTMQYLPEGSEVFVVKGMWSSFFGTVDKPQKGDPDGLPIFLALFGRETRVIIDRTFVQPVPDAVR